MTTIECARCGAPMDELGANPTADGLVCDLCLSEQRETPGLVVAGGLAVLAGLATCVSVAVSRRSTSTISRIVDGVEHGTRMIGVDAFGLGLSGVALLITLVAGVVAIRARPRSSRTWHRLWQAAALLVLLGLAALAALRFLHALPREVAF